VRGVLQSPKAVSIRSGSEVDMGPSGDEGGRVDEGPPAVREKSMTTNRGGRLAEVSPGGVRGW